MWRQLKLSQTKWNRTMGRMPSQRIRAFQTLEELAAKSMLQAFQRDGHLGAKLDLLPYGNETKKLPASLRTANFTPLLQSTEPVQFLGNHILPTALYNRLKDTYCDELGVEMLHLSSDTEREWLTRQLDQLQSAYSVSPSEKRNAYTNLVMSDVLETFLHKKFPSLKRYSGEGAEAMLPAVNTILQQVCEEGVTDVVMGMPHRGRLALLVTLLDYPAHKLFYKIKGNSEFPSQYLGIDDVISHISASTDKTFGDRKIHATLLHNPSHLEIINPVATGKVRAKNEAGAKGMALLLHGDAAFSGQGCVAEGLTLSQLPSFSTDGTIHLVVNNQVGYTTTVPDSRSTRYSTDIAKSIEAPIIHVNGDNLESLLQACKLAVKYRSEFKKDIVIDMISYRKYGHNEVDEPRFTQPLMYRDIDKTPNIQAKVAKQLLKEGLITNKYIEKLYDQLQKQLNKELQIAEEFEPKEVDAFKGNWSQTHQPCEAELHTPVVTGVSNIKDLVEIGIASVSTPPTFRVHERLERTHIRSRKSMLSQDTGDIKVDWATAEAMAFGSLLREGFSVRLSGEDSRRGTFSQRHAAFYDQEDEQLYFPLKHLEGAKGTLDVVNSNLSELAVMGFEYGYSWEDPKNLVIWEGQFGDFYNGAQIVIDQFISSGESKWMRQSGLVLLLPHGSDGAGSDHSSGHVERFLQMCDSQGYEPVGKSGRKHKPEVNMCIVNPTTPANYFHVLRRQQHREFRKPLIVMGPKTLLRLPEAVSSIEEMGPETCFEPVIDDPDVPHEAETEINRILLCSGKIYYALKERQSMVKCSDAAIVRVEELAPFPEERLRDVLDRYPNAASLSWVQDEPSNYGPWIYMKVHCEHLFAAGLAKSKISSIDAYTFKPLPACAVGLSKAHKLAYEDLLTQVFPTCQLLP